jgi:hypothetical protein
MTMKFLSNNLRSAQRGQAILLIALAMVGLVAFVGLMVDVGVLFIEQGKIKRGIDSGSIAAVQQFRKGFDAADLVAAAQNFLLLNDTAADQIIIYRCKDNNPADGVEDLATVGDGTVQDPSLCTSPRRKLIRVEAQRWVPFSFLRVIGIQGRMITASSVSEAASIDIVLVIDTSTSMAYETYTGPCATDGLDKECASVPVDDENPAVCNIDSTTPCEPLNSVKDVALLFINTMFFPYDRVSVVAMTGQDPAGSRDHVTVLQLSDDQSDVTDAINSLTVFEPPNCDSNPAFGPCIKYDAGTFLGLECPVYRDTGDPSSCNSSNIGGSLLRAGGEFTRTGLRRDEALWIIILLAGGPANATNSAPGFDHGYCPDTTWDLVTNPFCRDASAATRHGDGDTDYDADDFARDQADFIADPDDGQGITVFTIGLGRLVQNASIGDPDAGEQLLEYVAEIAGDETGSPANHGFYSYAPTTAELDDIFTEIAANIFTRITQ